MSGERCEACRQGVAYGARVSMAFQPIVDVRDRSVFAYEALVRGPAGEGAAGVLAAVDADNRSCFDQVCRARAIEQAAGLGLRGSDALLSINFMPNAVHPTRVCLEPTLEAARRAGLSAGRLVLEFTEHERVEHEHLARIVAGYKAHGLKTAMDDFGAGFSGLSLLAKFQPDIVKLDMELVRDLDSSNVKRLILASVVRLCRDLGVEVIAEGIETVAEYHALVDLGIWLQQGYLFARPGFEALPQVAWPEATPVSAAA